MASFAPKVLSAIHPWSKLMLFGWGGGACPGRRGLQRPGGLNFMSKRFNRLVGFGGSCEDPLAWFLEGPSLKRGGKGSILSPFLGHFWAGGPSGQLWGHPPGFTRFFGGTHLSTPPPPTPEAWWTRLVKQISERVASVMSLQASSKVAAPARQIKNKRNRPTHNSTLCVGGVSLRIANGSSMCIALTFQLTICKSRATQYFPRTCARLGGGWTDLSIPERVTEEAFNAGSRRGCSEGWNLHPRVWRRVRFIFVPFCSSSENSDACNLVSIVNRSVLVTLPCVTQWFPI